MISLIEVKGFRSFSQESFQKIELQPFTVIVGENDTGKSNLLKAIMFVLDHSTDNIVKQDFNIRKSPSRSGKIVDKKAAQISIKIHFTNKQKLLPMKFRKGRRVVPGSDGFIITCVASGHSKETYQKEYRLNGKKIEGKLAPELLSKIKYFMTPSTRDVSHLNELKKFLPLEKSSVITQAIKRFTSVIKSKLKKQEALFKKAADAQRLSIDPVLDSEKILELLDFDFLLLKDDIPVFLKNHGQGLISRIIISSFLAQGRNHIIGIEEPEIHMHPNLLRCIVQDCEKIVKKNTQVIIVTHSNYLINSVPIKNILIARKDAKYTKITKVMPPSSEVAQRIEQTIFLARQKTEILFAKGVILVEGPYDRRIFTAIDLKEKHQTFNEGITIVEVGSDSFSPYIELCIQCNISWSCIGDSKAFYSPEHKDRGNLLKAITKYVGEDPIKILQEKIETGKPVKKALSTVNKLLHSKKGHILNLSGGDISDTLVACLNKKNDDALYKTLFIKYGGHSGETDASKIKSDVERTIKRKKDDMILAVHALGKSNEVQQALKKSFNALVQSNKRIK